MRRLSFAVAVLTILMPHNGLAHDPASKVKGPADAYVYELAAPGSYHLPRIRMAADAQVLDETGTPRGLSMLFKGRITVLAFLYTRCTDVCPLAALRLSDLQILAAADPTVAAELQLVALSFDPDHDTPSVMAAYGEQMRVPGIAAPRWLFLTAASQTEIAPVLADYDQPVARKAGKDDPNGPLSHLLRVFLIDSEGFIRNIYSADFLDPRLLMNDVRTLQLEAAG